MYNVCSAAILSMLFHGNAIRSIETTGSISIVQWESPVPVDPLECGHNSMEPLYLSDPLKPLEPLEPLDPLEALYLSEQKIQKELWRFGPQ